MFTCSIVARSSNGQDGHHDKKQAKTGAESESPKRIPLRPLKWTRHYRGRADALTVERRRSTGIVLRGLHPAARRHHRLRGKRWSSAIDPFF